MANKIILCADSTCDLGDELGARYNVHFFPYNVILDDKTYTDGVDIQPEDIYRTYREKGLLPKTAAVNISNYIDFFKEWTDQGYDIIHVNLASSLSSSHQNCLAAARELGNVYPIDSRNLSTGSALLVIEAAERIAKGMPAEHIAEELNELRDHVHASFILDTLEFLRAGGRCSALASMGSNLLRLKVSIEVDNSTGKMGVGKIYRGNLQKQRLQYTKDQLGRYPNIKKDRVFITHSGVSEESIAPVYDYIKGLNLFDEIFVTQASCTISAHCGPETLGVLFMTEE
ncbi:MAG: DegV family protein [Clostridiales bacterium]|jgi:DegV family protein with EDD domain|nr:DegV family protein [Clostridiales bacterium]